MGLSGMESLDIIRVRLTFRRVSSGDSTIAHYIGRQSWVAHTYHREVSKDG